VFAYPSLYEGFGIPYIEAMASGTAIVTTPNGGARDVLENGRFGLIRDDDAFGAAIIELLDNEALRHSLAEAGLARAPLYSPDSICAQIEQVYRDTFDQYARGQ
jgi:glycosyltransferase involved in cell wall biosynthesis